MTASSSNERLLLRHFFADKERMDLGRIGRRGTVAPFSGSRLLDCLSVAVSRAVDRSKSGTATQDELAAHAT